MAVPKYHEFMKSLLEMLGDSRDHKIQALYADLADHFKLTEADKAEYLPIGGQLATIVIEHNCLELINSFCAINTHF